MNNNELVVETKAIAIEDAKAQGKRSLVIANPDRTDTLINALTTLWKASVRATHHFLHLR